MESSTSSSFSSSNDIDVKWPPFNPFVRHPTSLLGKILMIVTGTFLVPIRLVGAIAVLSLGWIWSKLVAIGLESSKDEYDPSAQPYSPIRRRVVFIGFRVLARMLLFCYGYIWIQQAGNADDATTSRKDEKKKEQLVEEIPKVVVCNHTGFVELLYLAYAYECCFVSKAENKHLPFMGLISQAMQCIFVERGHGIANNTSQKIRERLEAEPGVWPMLSLAPEGTTSNGHAIIHFHTGAFRPGQPVLPIAIELPFSPVWGYDPSFSCANMTLHIMGLMSQPWNRLIVHKLPVHVPTKAEKADAQLFANNVRQKMADALNIPVFELQWRHKLMFEPSAKKRALGEKMLMEKNGGVLPPPPVFTKDVFGNDILARTSSMRSDDKKEQ